MVTFEFTPDEVTVFCNLLTALQGMPIFKRRNTNETVEKIACRHLQIAVYNKHFAKLMMSKPQNGKVTYKFAPHEALAIYSFTAQKKEFYFFNVQVETNDNI